MIPVDLRKLVGRLNRFGVRTMEGAAGLCVSRGHHEVTVEHLLARLIEEPRSDFGLALAHFEVDTARLARAVEQSLEDLRGGHAGKPVFSPILVEWLEDAWMLASLELSLPAIRSGALAIALATKPRRLLLSDLPELDKLRADVLRERFDAIVAGSIEDTAAVTAHAAGELPRAAGARAADSALGRFTTDLTAAARAGTIDPVIGRDAEIRQVIDILSRRRKNNPIVVGDAGVGKTAIVEGLALRVAAGDVPAPLKDVEILGLDIGLLQAGAGVKGEFESRLKAVIQEVKASTRGTILFIDEAHTLVGAGAAAGGSDAANLLKPALARGELRTIAATTWAEYKKYFEEDAALARRFQPVKVDEPSVALAAEMLRGLSARYEGAHGVRVTDDAIEAAAQLSARYISGRLLPDKAVDLLDTAASRVRVAQSSKPAAVEDLERSIAALERQAETLRRDLRGGTPVSPARLAGLDAKLTDQRASLVGLKERWKRQVEAAETVLAARRAADPSASDASPDVLAALAALRAACAGEPLVRVDVDADVVAEVVQDWTGVPVGRMVTSDAARVQQLESLLRERVRGQEHALATVSRVLRAAKAGLSDPGKPRVFLLVGPSGVGKTELGLALADALFGGERFAVTINMSEYQDREMGVSGLIGAKPGYVGYGKGGTLTEAVRQRPYCVVLLDEIEKACQEVRNLFYQVFDKGELTDGTGRRVDFKNTVVLMTSNLTADVIQRMCAHGARPKPEDVLAAIRPVLSRVLQPAWLARTTVVPFTSLADDALAEIARLKLDRLGARLREAHGAELEVGAEVVPRLVSRCREVETGARNLDFVLQDSLLPLLSNAVLGALAEGRAPKVLRVELDAPERGGFVVVTR